MPVPTVLIKVLAKCQLRDPERWKQTLLYNEIFELVTDLDYYSSDLTPFLEEIDTYITTERDLSATVAAHYSISIENMNPDKLSAGSIRAPKQHFDSQLAFDEFTTELLREKIEFTIVTLRQHAKY